ncbi:hypothetical protein LCGC14_0147460 [marine sediment metagenome]|uniref:Uncharacterized protein n=1 Tax=marine sediment metagenome TaxID=412755 RepID=A0A0F9V3Q9_9ZZZZ
MAFKTKQQLQSQDWIRSGENVIDETIANRPHDALADNTNNLDIRMSSVEDAPIAYPNITGELTSVGEWSLRVLDDQIWVDVFEFTNAILLSDIVDTTTFVTLLRDDLNPGNPYPVVPVALTFYEDPDDANLTVPGIGDKTNGVKSSGGWGSAWIGGGTATTLEDSSGNLAGADDLYNNGYVHLSRLDGTWEFKRITDFIAGVVTVEGWNGADPDNTTDEYWIIMDLVIGDVSINSAGNTVNGNADGFYGTSGSPTEPRPYLRFSHFIPSSVKYAFRYGVKRDISTLPPDALIKQSIAGVIEDANLISAIVDIKGASLETPVDDNKDLFNHEARIALHSHVDDPTPSAGFSRIAPPTANGINLDGQSLPVAPNLVVNGDFMLIEGVGQAVPQGWINNAGGTTIAANVNNAYPFLKLNTGAPAVWDIVSDPSYAIFTGTLVLGDELLLSVEYAQSANPGSPIEVGLRFYDIGRANFQDVVAFTITSGFGAVWDWYKLWGSVTVPATVTGTTTIEADVFIRNTGMGQTLDTQKFARLKVEWSRQTVYETTLPTPFNNFRTLVPIYDELRNARLSDTYGAFDNLKLRLDNTDSIVGIADADTVDSLHAVSFLRSDAPTTAAGIVLFTARPLLENNVYLEGHNAAQDTSYSLIGVDSSDQVLVGNPSLPLFLQTSARIEAGDSINVPLGKDYRINGGTGLQAQITPNTTHRGVVSGNPHVVTLADIGAAPSGEGVLNGNSHDHIGGDGALINTDALVDDAVTGAKIAVLTESLVLANNVTLLAKETGGGTQILAAVNDLNQLLLGDNNLPAIIRSSATVLSNRSLQVGVGEDFLIDAGASLKVHDHTVGKGGDLGANSVPTVAIEDLAVTTPKMDLVSARYIINGGQSITHQIYTVVDFKTKTFDDPGTDRVTIASPPDDQTNHWKFTADRDMKVRVNAAVQFETSSVWSAGEQIQLWIYKSDGPYSQLTRNELTSSPATWRASLNGCDIVSLLNEEWIDIRIYQNSGSTRIILASTTSNYVSIEEF